MECREFQHHLSDYLGGELGEPFFGQMVEHEVECTRCRATVLEADVLPSPLLDTKERRQVQEQIRVRTEGRDCHWIELRMAEALEESLDPSDREIVRVHIEDCASCQRMRDMLQALPDFYSQLPELSAGREFTREVLALTSGPVPGVIQILRALWRRPEAVWEVALAGGLVVAILFGNQVPEYSSMSAWVKDAAVAQMPMGNQVWKTEDGKQRFGFVTDGAAQVHTTWKKVEEKAGGVSDWMQRSGEDIRTGDYTGLLDEIRVVLEPLGLYPEDETQEAGEQGDER